MNELERLLARLPGVILDTFRDESFTRNFRLLAWAVEKQVQDTQMEVTTVGKCKRFLIKMGGFSVKECMEQRRLVNKQSRIRPTVSRKTTSVESPDLLRVYHDSCHSAVTKPDGESRTGRPKPETDFTRSVIRARRWSEKDPLMPGAIPASGQSGAKEMGEGFEIGTQPMISVDAPKSFGDTRFPT
ncbi:hypothetical protein K438DRAFT_1783048 [Mycena galopus ATCC 62051]|nr:hypothetical protein K438DRAFT_1783048 [Mycena galopus ATCC 62051]